MNITVTFIGRYKTIVGKPELTLTVTKGDTIWHVVDLLVGQFPDLEKDKRFMIVSYNGVYASKERKISTGDHITIAPPIVSGG
ncbi:MAG: MoaD/ThiS family protein [Methanobacteriota archaeon]